MSMSCLRIRSSSKSSGPSYTSTTETANGESLSSCSFFADLSPDSRTAFADFSGLARSATTNGASSRSPCPDLTTFSFMLLPIIHRRWFVIERHPHRLAHIVHGFTRRLARPFRACLKNIPSQPRILLEFLTPLLYRNQQLHQRIRRPTLALDAPNARRAATGVHICQRFLATENLVQVSHRTNIRIPRIRSE